MSNINYIGLREPYLNVFYAYGDKAHLENNITKAFVNVLESLNENQIKRVFKELFGFELNDGKYHISYFLQKKPKREFVEKYPNRIMFAFSPTGESRGIEGLNNRNEHEIRKATEEYKKTNNDCARKGCCYYQLKTSDETLMLIKNLNKKGGKICYRLMNVKNI